VNVLTATIVPRSLGPASYGDFQFITSTATAMRTLLDSGMSSAHFTYASKHERSGLGSALYAVWLVLQLVLIFVLIAIAHFGGLQGVLWPGQTATYLYAMVGLEWTNFVGTVLLQLGDAKALTVRVQVIGVLGQVVKGVLLVAFYETGHLHLDAFIMASYVGALCIVFGLLVRFVLPNWSAYFARAASGEQRSDVGRYYIAYCAPLALYTVVGFAYDFFDRWFLQTVAGSTQQGFFGLAMQWSALSLFFTTSLLNILWRELAVSLAHQDLNRVRRLYVRSSSLLYILAAVVGCYTAMNAPNLIRLLAGSGYREATAVVVIMSFLPVFQTLGQINGTFFFATERVRVYRNLGIAGMIFGMAVSYVLLAPNTLPVPGLHLGAVGLALKLVLASLVMGNVFIYSNARYLDMRVAPLLRRQVTALAAVALAAGLARVAVDTLSLSPWIALSLTAVVTLGLAVALVAGAPDLAGVTREDIRAGARWLWHVTTPRRTRGTADEEERK
jgi:O-antigen/teichoic acid export membrane protein